jgi:hypothetical protein
MSPAHADDHCEEGKSVTVVLLLILPVNSKDKQETAALPKPAEPEFTGGACEVSL